MLFNNNPYQQHIYMTSAGKISSAIYEWRNGITSYFHLKEINEDLHRHNANLLQELTILQNQVIELKALQYADTMSILPELSQYEFRIANVINNSITHSHNFITINKGSDDGVEQYMGVLDQNGIVGFVDIVGKKNSRIISILNPDLSISCMIKGSDNFGSLRWDGKHPQEAVLEGLPKHAVANKGDTIITSGFSDGFPKGIPVGIVLTQQSELDDNFFALRIKLLADFSTLSTVKLVKNTMKDELDKLNRPKNK